MIRIRLYSRAEGKPLSSTKVSLYFDGFFTGGFANDEYTNSDGEAYFADSDPNRDGEIYAKGDKIFKGTIKSDMTLFID